MEWTRHVLFEDPTWICVILAAAESVLALWWVRRRGRKAVVLLAIPPVLAAAAVLTGVLVQTEREKIANVLTALGEAVQTGDFDRVELYLDGSAYAPRRDGSRMSRQELIDRARQTVRNYPLKKVTLSEIETSVAGVNATTVLSTVIVFGEGSLMSGQTVKTHWKLQWAKRPGGWMLTRVEPTPLEVLATWSF